MVVALLDRDLFNSHSREQEKADVYKVVSSGFGSRTVRDTATKGMKEKVSVKGKGSGTIYPAAATASGLLSAQAAPEPVEAV
jgi:hypothetical protein